MEQKKWVGVSGALKGGGACLFFFEVMVVRLEVDRKGQGFYVGSRGSGGSGKEGTVLILHRSPTD